MALPGSGLLWMTQIRDEFRPGAAVYDLYSYYRNHGIITDNADNANIPWIGSMIWFSQFHGAFKANAGSWDQGTPGTYSIWVPPVRWLRMRCWGAGAGGGAYNGGHGPVAPLAVTSLAISRLMAVVAELSGPANSCRLGRCGRWQSGGQLRRTGPVRRIERQPEQARVAKAATVLAVVAAGGAATRTMVSTAER